jgi:hypothetical protein
MPQTLTSWNGRPVIGCAFCRERVVARSDAPADLEVATIRMVAHERERHPVRRQRQAALDTVKNTTASVQAAPAVSGAVPPEAAESASSQGTKS